MARIPAGQGGADREDAGPLLPAGLAPEGAPGLAPAVGKPAFPPGSGPRSSPTLVQAPSPPGSSLLSFFQHKTFWDKSEWTCMTPCPATAPSATEASIYKEQM